MKLYFLIHCYYDTESVAYTESVTTSFLVYVYLLPLFYMYFTLLPPFYMYLTFLPPFLYLLYPVYF